MSNLKLRHFVLLGCFAMLAMSAFADVPTNLIVDRGGYQWVWAAPCAPAQPSCGNALTLTDGWSIPTTGQWQSSFTDTMDVYNVFTMNGTGQLCASAYFDSGYTHCDSGDLQQGYIWGAPAPIGNSDANNPASEAFLVRADVAPVPEPSSFLLLGSGALGIFGTIRRKLLK